MEIEYQDLGFSEESLLKLKSFLSEYKATFKLNISSLPIQPRRIKRIYKKFLEEHKESIMCFIVENFNVVNIGDEQIDMLLEKKILEPVMNESNKLMKKSCMEDINNFASNYNLVVKFNLEESMTFLNDNIEKDDHMLKNLWAIKKLDLDDKSRQRKNSGNPNSKQNFHETVKHIHTNMCNLHLFLLKTMEKIYDKYELTEEFRASSIQNDLEIQKTLKNNFNGNFPYVAKELKDILEKIQQTKIKHIKSEIQVNIRNSLSSFCDFNSFKIEYKKVVRDELNEELRNNLGFEPSGLFISETKKKIFDVIDSYLIERLSGLMKNHQFILNHVKPLLDSLLFKYLTAKDSLFSPMKIDNNAKKLLFEIICYSFYNISGASDHGDLLKFIKMIKDEYFLENHDLREFCTNLYEKIANFEDYELQTNTQFFNKNIAAKSKLWADIVDENVNLFTIFSVIMCVQGILVSDTGIHISKYNAKYRFFAKMLLRNLRNGDFDYLNFQLLTCLEANLEEIFSPPGLSNSTFDFIGSAKIHWESEDNLLGMLRAGSMEAKTETNKSIEKALMAMKQRTDGKVPKEFFFQKLSKNKSRVITILISGFLSSDTSKETEWKNYLDHDMDTEIFSLNWDSCSTKEQIFDIGQNIGSLFTLKKLVANKYIQLASLGYWVFNQLKDNPFSRAHAEAKICGIFLAYLLSEGLIFANCAVNLVGFSLGTVLITECLVELEKIGKKNIVSNVVLIGGCANKKVLDKKKWEAVSGKLANCYSKNDAILKYLFKIAKLDEKPIGLDPITPFSESKDKVENYDLTDMVKGHGEYRNLLKEILRKIDFERDFSPLTANLN